jgi:ATP-dependent Clp endopeptidase proteolytic subunit ClpP
MSKVLESMIHVHEHNIYFNGNIDAGSMSKLTSEIVKLETKIMKDLGKFRRNLDKYIEKELSDEVDMVIMDIQPKPIYLYITSPGGIVTQALAVYDLIRDLRVPVYTVCKGLVASAGTIISMAGKKRFITPNSYMLIHQLSASHSGTFEKLGESYENSKILMEALKRIYVGRTKITAEEIDEILKHDLYWDAETCLEKGLVDSKKS